MAEYDYSPLPVLGRDGLSHRRPAALGRFWFGACYYPEHWSAEEREDDPRLMQEAGLNLVRMGEFAWDILEPREGEYDFTLFAETIERLGARGIKTMFCTPTATPPRWLTRRYPQILRVSAAGQAMQHGSRQHCCHTSPLFRAYSRRITAALAGYFKDNPHVVGWQTDNEINCHFRDCYCQSCAAAFADFLRVRYGGDINRLNADWGNAFWALTYERFEDVPLPRDCSPAYDNPSHRLVYEQFVSENVARFQHEQVEILRAANPHWFVTHNGVFNIDYRGAFTKDLDFLGYDVYPFFCNDHALRMTALSYHLDRVRALSGNFMIPEHQSGPGGQRPYFHDTPEPGEVRRMSYVSIARGADSLLYFRWRTCRFGAEEYWCGIIDHDNIPRRRYAEIKQIGAELARVGAEVPGTSVVVNAAVASGDYAVNNAHESLPLGLPTHNMPAEEVHRGLFRAGLAAGCVHPSDDLTGIGLYVIPHWALFDPAWVPNLERFVENGGTLVVGARTATRDPRNQVVAQTIPGCLAGLCGVTVEEYGKQNAPAGRPYNLSFGGREVRSEIWYEVLAPGKDTQTVAIWSSRHLAGKAAVTLRTLGKGRVYYVGTYLCGDILGLLLPEFIRASGVCPLLPGIAPGVEVVLREDAQKRLWFLINHNETEVRLSGLPRGEELVRAAACAGDLLIDAGGVAVIREAI